MEERLSWLTLRAGNLLFAVLPDLLDWLNAR
jgi:hypothetical protein